MYNAMNIIVNPISKKIMVCHGGSRHCVTMYQPSGISSSVFVGN